VIFPTVKFLRLCGKDVRCAGCGKTYWSAMEETYPLGLCGPCVVVAWPAPLRDDRVFEEEVER
jgi:hypothetical protein